MDLKSGSGHERGGMTNRIRFFAFYNNNTHTDMILQTNFNINVLALISCSKGLTQNGNVFLGRLLKGSKKRKKVLTYRVS